ncbi:hypothetical protein Bbelb_185870 [Branchiostoma belcheri]|nr:hypothetical protein Bbelb_185870 [Branchiostoma belcheri]
MVQTWLTALDSKKPTLVRALFADMSKAFDRVDHAILLQHVIDIQASPHMVTWIHSYLSGRRQRVVVNGVASSWKEPTSGVPQGGVLSPYLFLLFMASRTTVHPDTMNVGYADDVSMSRTILVRQADEDNTLKEETSHLDSWANTNNMLLNGKKSQMLQICLCRSVPSPPRLTLGGACVPWVDSAKGLGFILDKNLTLQEQVTSMVTKASRRLHYLRLLSKQGTSVADLVLVYLALVRPVLEYGHVLLVGCSKEQERAMERVQRRALRIISRAGRRDVPELPTLQSRREDAAVKLLGRCSRRTTPYTTSSLSLELTPLDALLGTRTLYPSPQPEQKDSRTRSYISLSDYTIRLCKRHHPTARSVKEKVEATLALGVPFPQISHELRDGLGDRDNREVGQLQAHHFISKKIMREMQRKLD